MTPTIKIIVGNILTYKADILVNSANKSLLRGSGLCGQIHIKAGKELEKVNITHLEKINLFFLKQEQAQIYLNTL